MKFRRILTMALTAVMTVSAVPTTAFAKGDISAIAKVVGAMEVTKAEVEEPLWKRQSYGDY